MHHRLSCSAALVVLTACSAGSSNDPPDSPPPVETGFTHIAIAGGRTCAVDVDRQLYCWGPRHGDDHGFATVPDRREQDEPVVEVTGQGWLMCAVGQSSTLTCDGEFLHDKNLLPVDDDRLARSTGLHSVAVSMGHGCGINARRLVECFGSMHDGKVGRAWDSAGIDSAGYDWQASAIPSDLPVRALTGGYRHSCALSRAEEVHCWGDSAVVGNPFVPFLHQRNPCGAGACLVAPVRVHGLGHARSIAAGQAHTCAATDAGTSCWGLNFAGQLGTPGAESSPVPVAVTLPSRALLLASGQSKTCAVAENGRVYCWGQWGGDPATAPVAVPGDYPRFTSLAVGSGQACGLFQGKAWCWGIQGSWLGNGNGNGSAVPVRIDIPVLPPS
jgi:alpha-tubulin suppressor-like RCC1 family protein